MASGRVAPATSALLEEPGLPRRVLQPGQRRVRLPSRSPRGGPPGDAVAEALQVPAELLLHDQAQRTSQEVDPLLGLDGLLVADRGLVAVALQDLRVPSLPPGDLLT